MLTYSRHPPTAVSSPCLGSLEILSFRLWVCHPITSACYEGDFWKISYSNLSTWVCLQKGTKGPPTILHFGWDFLYIFIMISHPIFGQTLPPRTPQEIPGPCMTLPRHSKRWGVEMARVHTSCQSRAPGPRTPMAIMDTHGPKKNLCRQVLFRSWGLTASWSLVDHQNV